MTQQRLFQEGATGSGSWESYLMAQLSAPSAAQSAAHANNEDSRDPRGPRLFSHAVKQSCWDRSPTMFSRDPSRWRLDAVGNPVMHGLKGCMGRFCHEYDHILPYSKGGHSVAENCQVLQTSVNRGKGNRTDCSFGELRGLTPVTMFDGREMDLIEHLFYGDVRRP